MWSKTIGFGVSTVLLAFLYSKWQDLQRQSLDDKEQSIIESWNSLITEPKRKFRRLSVGINCNVDLIVSGTDLLTALGQAAGESLDSASLETIEDLTNTFSHFFQKGAAAERAFKNGNVYKQVIETAQKLPLKEHHIGGNAALMAAKVTELFPETKIQLIGPIGPALQQLLPAGVTIPGASHVSSDEVHLIMEYGFGENWGSLSSPVANRFMTNCDKSNSELTMLKNFFAHLEKFDSELIVFSGLHLLDSQDSVFIAEKMNEVKEGLKTIQMDVPVHLELASMASEGLVHSILDKVVPYVTSLGLNEQELSFSAYVANGPHFDDFHTRTGQPEVHKVSDMVLWLLKKYGYSKDNQNSRLTRVHFHSLTYHIVGTLPNAWHNTESAVAAGTRMAGRQACDSKKLSPPDIELRIPQTFKLFSGDIDHTFDEKNPVLSWEREGFHFVFSPVLVCISPSKTVGLGDAISATGLMYSEFDISYRAS